MHRAIPSISKVLSKKWESENYRKHTQRLEEIKGLVQTKSPVVYDHLKVKAKLQMQKKERNAEIKKDTDILNKKINILKRKKSEKYDTLRIINQSRYQIADKQNQINKSNWKLFEKVENVSSKYRLELYIDDRKKIEERLKNIGDFPYFLKNPESCKSKSKTKVIGKKLVYSESVVKGEESVLIKVFEEKNHFRIKCKTKLMQKSISRKLDKATVQGIVGENRDYTKLANIIDTSDGILRININTDSLPNLRPKTVQNKYRTYSHL